MGRKLIAVALCTLVVAGLAHGQDAYRAGQALGGVLFGRGGNDAYLEGAIQGAIAREHLDHAREMEAQTELIERTHAIQMHLAQWMIRVGWDQQEAKAIALAYRISPEEPAIIARARREGSAATAQAINKAYQDYNYLLADQLMLGLAMALQDEGKVPIPDR